MDIRQDPLNYLNYYKETMNNTEVIKCITNLKTNTRGYYVLMGKFKENAVSYGAYSGQLFCVVMYPYPMSGVSYNYKLNVKNNDYYLSYSETNYVTHLQLYGCLSSNKVQGSFLVKNTFPSGESLNKNLDSISSYNDCVENVVLMDYYAPYGWLSDIPPLYGEEEYDSSISQVVNTEKCVFSNNYLYERLPDIYRSRDIEENINYTLKKYLGVLQEELNTLGKDTIALENLYDLEKCPKEFLPIISKMLGYDYIDEVNEGVQRKILSALFYLYKRRGTKQVLEYIAREFTGGNAIITEYSTEDKNPVFNTWSKELEEEGKVTDTFSGSYTSSTPIYFTKDAGKIEQGIVITLVNDDVDIMLLKRLLKQFMPFYCKVLVRGTPKQRYEDRVNIKCIDSITKPLYEQHLSLEAPLSIKENLINNATMISSGTNSLSVNEESNDLIVLSSTYIAYMIVANLCNLCEIQFTDVNLARDFMKGGIEVLKDEINSSTLSGKTYEFSITDNGVTKFIEYALGKEGLTTYPSTLTNIRSLDDYNNKYTEGKPKTIQVDSDVVHMHQTWKHEETDLYLPTGTLVYPSGVNVLFETITYLYKEGD